MVLREILDSKLGSVFMVSFLFHKNASSQGNAIERVSCDSIHTPGSLWWHPDWGERMMKKFKCGERKLWTIMDDL